MKNPVLECIYTRRSVRDYLNKPVPKEIIDELLAAAVMAPSAMNRQPWHFSIVEDKENLDYFNDRALKQWKIAGIGMKLAMRLQGYGSVFYNAPLLIVVSGKKGYEWLKDDVGLAVQNMFLAAHSLGLGSCWIGFAKPLNKDDVAKKRLGIPKDFEIVAPLIFGYAKRSKKKIPKRKPKVLKWIKNQQAL